MSDRVAMRAFLWSGAALMVSLGVALIRSNWASVDEIRQLSGERAALQSEQSAIWRERLDGMDKRLQDLTTRVKVLELQENQRVKEAAWAAQKQQ
jgi:hypothetical protein